MNKTYDTILNDILIDMSNSLIQNADGTYQAPNTSKGSVFYVIAVALAACVWGIYKARDFLIRQMFASTANSENLERLALDVGISRKPNETDKELLTRYMMKRRQPVNVGNTEQYRLWATSIENVKSAWVYAGDKGIGTVTIDIIATGDSEIPSQELLTAVHAACTNPNSAPAWAGRVFVQSPTFTPVDISITATITNPMAVANTVRSYVNQLDMAAELTHSAIAILLFSIGVTDSTITFTVDAATAQIIKGSKHELLRSGVITINNEVINA